MASQKQAAGTVETEHSNTSVDGVELVVSSLPDLIDSEAFTPRLIALLSNALVWRESHLLRNQFDLGTNDWRVISALAIKPGATATDISDFLVLNKAVVSKAVNTLISRELISSTEGARGSRNLYLTTEGARVHDQMLPISLSGEEILLSGLSSREQAQLRKLLSKMMLEIPHLSPQLHTPTL